MSELQMVNREYIQVLLRGTIECTTSDNLIVFYLRIEDALEVNRWQQIYFREKKKISNLQSFNSFCKVALPFTEVRLKSRG